MNVSPGQLMMIIDVRKYECRLSNDLIFVVIGKCIFGSFLGVKRKLEEQHETTIDDPMLWTDLESPPIGVIFIFGSFDDLESL